MYKIKQTYRITSFFANKAKYVFLIAIALFIVSCEKWYDTEEVSHVSYLPEFEIKGGEFLSYVVTDSAEYTDQGALAFEKDRELEVISIGEVDLTEVGVYIIAYYAFNRDGLLGIGERIVAVTNEDVSGNDLSGKYETSRWGEKVEMKVTKIDNNGLYKCSEVFGYPGSEMKGKIVDLGDHELVLVHGEGDFGRFASTLGEYTLSSLSLTVKLIDEQYNNLELGIFWRRVKD